MFSTILSKEVETHMSIFDQISNSNEKLCQLGLATLATVNIDPAHDFIKEFTNDFFVKLLISKLQDSQDSTRQLALNAIENLIITQHEFLVKTFIEQDLFKHLE